MRTHDGSNGLYEYIKEIEGIAPLRHVSIELGTLRHVFLRSLDVPRRRPAAAALAVDVVSLLAHLAPAEGAQPHPQQRQLA